MMYPIELIRGTWLLYRIHLGTIIGSRRSLAAIAIAAIPVLLTFLATQFGPDRPTGQKFFDNIGMVLTIGFAIPLLAAALGVGVVSSESESRTITYPFTRPIPRASLFLGRWLAGLTLLGLLCVGITYGMAASAEIRSPVEHQYVNAMLTTLLVGVTVYSLAAAVVGTLFKRGLVVALGYIFAFEQPLVRLPGSGRKLTIQHYLQSNYLDGRTGRFGVDGVINTENMIEGADALQRMGITTGVLLLLGMWIVTRKQFVLSS